MQIGRVMLMKIMGCNRKGCRIWDPKGNNIIIQRDLIFGETNILLQEEKREPRNTP